MDSESEAIPSYDVVVIGAGLSGINAAYRVQEQMPACSFTILESRDRLGGTWSYWQYPGIRCDSSMAVFSLAWHPWPHTEAIAKAPAIIDYIEDAARTHGISDKVRLSHRATAASWDSKTQQWTLDVEVKQPSSASPVRKQIRTWFIINCGGYYDYDRALATTIPGLDRFKGTVLHPQFWPAAGDASASAAGKRVVLIGSGATAVTMLPALADQNPAQLTMLQRSPSFVFAVPGSLDPASRWAQRRLPAAWAAWLIWWAEMIIESLAVGFLTTFTGLGRRFLLSEARKRLPKGFNVEKHFAPSYDPMEQRLCFTPDGDFFDALRRDECEIVTDAIDTVTEDAVRTKSGREIPADMIVTATGLHMRVFGAFRVTVDGEPVSVAQVSERFLWNGILVEGLPNIGTITGYITMTWTPGADARARIIIKLMKRMRRKGVGAAVPAIEPAERARLPRKPAMPNSSTYLVNARSRLPIVADVGPWRNRGRWWRDWLFLLFGNLDEGLKLTPRTGSAEREEVNGKVKVP